MARTDVFIKNLEDLSEKKHMSPSAALAEMGFSNSTYTYWKHANSLPRRNSLQRIADYFGVTIGDLLGEDEKINIAITRRPTEIISTFGNKPIIISNRLPIYGFVSAGKGIYAEEDLIGYEFADECYSAPEYFYLQIRGDSMSPRIDEGDLVLIHKQDWIDSGQIGIFVVGEEAYCKKIEYREDELALVSFNPYYPPIRFKPGEEQEVHVMGRVLESKRKYE